MISGRLFAAMLACAISGTAIATASAQSYPSRPVTLVVPFPAGGGNDALARLVAERMSDGLAAPAGTPPAIVQRLNKELQVALADAGLRKRLDAEGGQVLPGTSADYAKTIDDEEKKWGPLVRGLSLKVD